MSWGEKKAGEHEFIIIGSNEGWSTVAVGWRSTHCPLPPLPHFSDTLQQSQDAFVHDREARLPLARAQAAAVNGDIVTDYDSDDGEKYLGLKSATSERAKALISWRKGRLWGRELDIWKKNVWWTEFLSSQTELSCPRNPKRPLRHWKGNRRICSRERCGSGRLEGVLAFIGTEYKGEAESRIQHINSATAPFWIS